MNKETYKNSSLDRAKPKHGFHAFINKTFKRHKADTTGLVEDSASSSTVIRIIVGLILIHLIVIGGVLLRSHIVKNDTGVAATAGITPPPVQQEVLPQPAPATQPVAHASTTTHITQSVDEMVAEEDPEPVVAPTQPTTAPSVATPVPANIVKVPHRVATGDTLTKIASQYGVTVAAIQEANPKSKDRIRAGEYLQIPVAADSEAAKKAGASAIIPTAPAAKTYTVQKGDNCGKIAKKHKISVQKLYQLNGMTEKDARRIKPGQKLIVGE